MRLAVLLAASLACVGIGFAKSAALSAHVKDLETLQKIIQYLRGEIVTAASPLPDAFWETGRRMRDPYRDFLQDISEDMRRPDGKPLPALLEENTAVHLPGTAPCRRRIWTGMRLALSSGSRNCRKDCRKGRGSVRVLESWEAFFYF